MLEALNRKTLKWEPLPLKNRHYINGAKFSDDSVVTPITALAIRGKERYQGYGYCSSCGRIMTKSEFEKHKHVYASKKCIECGYFCFKKSGNKCLCKKDKSIVYETQGICSWKYPSETLTKDTICTKNSCNGRFIQISKTDMIMRINRMVPKEILTIGSMVGNKAWAMSGYKNDYITFKNKKHKKLTARFDSRGFLFFYSYKKTSFTTLNFIYRSDIDKFYYVDEDLGIVSLPESIEQEIRRIYI